MTGRETCSRLRRVLLHCSEYSKSRMCNTVDKSKLYIIIFVPNEETNEEQTHIHCAEVQHNYLRISVVTGSRDSYKTSISRPPL